MTDTEPMSNGLPNGGFRPASFHEFINGGLRSVAVLAALFWAGDAQARSCADLYIAIKLEATGCGFFCDQARLKPLQETYSATCIPGVLPLSPFDLDSIPQDTALLADNGRIDVEATSSGLRR